jgi:hypothetical protein
MVGQFADLTVVSGQKKIDFLTVVSGQKVAGNWPVYADFQHRVGLLGKTSRFGKKD